MASQERKTVLDVVVGKRIWNAVMVLPGGIGQLVEHGLLKEAQEATCAPGCNVNSKDTAGTTGLHAVARLNTLSEHKEEEWVALLEKLRQRGADVHIKDAAGTTALEAGTTSRFSRIKDWFLVQGACAHRNHRTLEDCDRVPG